jgi:hypothetical protein
VDWPAACVGPAWADLLFMLPSAAMHGSVRPEHAWAAYPPAASADPAAVTVMLAALSGYFASNALQPPPAGLPRLRAFQAAQGRAALAWLAVRLDSGALTRRAMIFAR